MENFSPSKPVFVRIALLALTGGAVFVSSASATQPRVRQVAALSAVRGYFVEPLANDTVRPAEKAFLEKAHYSARLQARMAELGASQAGSSDVRSHAEQLKSDTRQLVDALTALTQKKGTESGPTGNAASDIYTQLSARTGNEFDREFVRVMAGLHEDTIQLFEQAAAESKDTDVRDLAAAQLPMLRAHLNKIIELKKTFD